MGKYFNFGNVTSMGKNSCTVNGKRIKVPTGSNVSINNGKVYINGKEYKEDGMDKLEVVHLTIEGDTASVDSECDVVVNGSVKGDVESGVNVSINGDVDGNVDAGVNVNIKGNQRGRVDAGVNVKIGTKVNG